MQVASTRVPANVASPYCTHLLVLIPVLGVFGETNTSRYQKARYGNNQKWFHIEYTSTFLRLIDFDAFDFLLFTYVLFHFERIPAKTIGHDTLFFWYLAKNLGRYVYFVRINYRVIHRQFVKWISWWIMQKYFFFHFHDTVMTLECLGLAYSIFFSKFVRNHPLQ